MSRTRTVNRTVKGSAGFWAEQKLPALNNITSHVGLCKKKKEYDAQKEEEQKKQNPNAPLIDQFNLRQSANVMADWLKDGELNPEVAITQQGFLRIFSAWILDESLPWTTGKAPTLRMMFQYLKVNVQLPSDTTVRNQLAKIFIELHGKVVREFAVCRQVFFPSRSAN